MKITNNKLMKMHLQKFAVKNVINELYNTNEVIDYVSSLERDYTLGDTLFPETKIDDIELSMIMGGNNLPVAASVHAWDSEAEIGDREGFEVVKQELALVKRKIRLAERDIVKLQTPRSNAELERVLANIYDDAANMVETVRTRFEAMRFEVLSTGRLALSENGYTGTIDYGVPDNHREEVTASWLDPDSDPLADLKKWQSQVQADTGVKPTRILTSERVAGAIEDHPSIRLAIFGNANQVVTREDLNNFLIKKGLPTFAVEDRSYRVRQGSGYVNKRYVPEDSLVIFPEGTLGNLVYGVTAEELALQADPSIQVDTDVNIVTTVWNTADPVATWTKATAVGLPSFPVADQVFIATGLLAAAPGI